MEHTIKKTVANGVIQVQVMERDVQRHEGETQKQVNYRERKANRVAKRGLTEHSHGKRNSS